jgi:hypothetical protein
MSSDQSNVVAFLEPQLRRCDPLASSGELSTVPSEDFRVLIAEALAIEAQHGKNAYTDYVLKHERRPPRVEAAGIGRRVGGQVRADDGTMQPPLTKGEQTALRGIKTRRRAAFRRYDQILRLRQAIAARAANEDDPADVLGGGSCLLRDSDISADLQAALSWLNRFAAEWHSREKEARA